MFDKINFSGEIRSVRQLDREEASEHHMEVEAVDGGTPRLTSTTTVTVVVLDENDNKPVVVQPLQKVISVREKQPVGTVVARIVATDADLEENATLLYEFHTGNWPGLILFRLWMKHDLTVFLSFQPGTVRCSI